MLCLCGCGQEIDASKSRGEPKRFFSNACKQRFYRNTKHGNRNTDVTKFALPDIRNTIICGDALSVLKRLPDASVQLCVTSPPYYGLRSYLPEGHPDKHLEIGIEETPQQYIARMVAVFREVRRVLRDNGLLFLNIGDSYAGSGKGGNEQKCSLNWKPVYAHQGRLSAGYKPKDLLMVPARLAIALQEDGWWLRQDIIWAKGNPMPESVEDRCTKSHEYVFLLAKSERYYYDADAVREPHVTASNVRDRAKENGWAQGALLTPIGEGTREWNHPNGRNKRSVWQINTQPFPEAHFAVMPSKLVEPCVLAGSSPKACEQCGSPWQRVVERTPMTIKPGPKSGGYGSRTTDGLSGTMVAPSESRTIGWEPTCTCQHNTGVGKCLVLDPFMGAGTTALVSSQLGRDWVGIELNADYIQLAMKRVEAVQQRLWGEYA